ncbi:thioredoxin [Sporosarcina sp. P26b]|uniref:thioredoxin family protein n=1 Tax=Sporosarcina TaxID=1569 RepID=UPI000A17B968|nr:MULTISPECIES: thioredoxin family protein [Sporosarcina]ARK21040.1 thioredoxin [Sporosarcina ureae]PIC73260.1 thioredoxin [Sporosarcina sp. P17b]PIC94938.1 thioredoxin [Sporosarcina sp. P26b]
MKKLLAIGGVIVVIFILIIVLNNKSNETKLAKNPYGTDNLQQSTIDLLDNESYQNVALPEEIFKQIESGEPTTVYYFSPDCPHCMDMTPRLMPIADEYDAHVYQYNMLEFSDQIKQEYDVTAWPTLVHYKDGKEQGRTVGSQPDDQIRAFFDEFESK